MTGAGRETWAWPGPEGSALEIRGLTVRHRGRVVVRNLSLTVPRGAVVALVGPKGCGKRILLRSLNRMAQEEEGVTVSGEVLVGGRNLLDAGVDPAEARRTLGLVLPQAPPLPGSILANLAFGPLVHGWTEDLDRRVDEALKSADLWEEFGERLDSPAAQLDRLGLQKLALARALALDPALLLLEDPTLGLEPDEARILEGLLRGLVPPRAALLATSSLQQAARLGDYAAFLLEGELVEFGPTPQVFTRPRDARTEAFLTGRDL